jgi:IPT/TIG domain
MKGAAMQIFRLLGFVFIFLFVLGVVGAATDPSQVLPTPVLRSVDPATVKPGDEATVLGEYLDKSRVAELYLTNGTVDSKVHILEQTATSIKFKVPEKIAPGRYNTMVLLVGDPAKLIEEPARVTVTE